MVLDSDEVGHLKAGKGACHECIITKQALLSGVCTENKVKENRRRACIEGIASAAPFVGMSSGSKVMIQCLDLAESVAGQNAIHLRE